jgi:uncharacterized peroxidase-related enzyme
MPAGDTQPLRQVAWVQHFDEGNADGELAKAFRDYRQRMGHLSNVAKALSLKPHLIPKWLDFQMAVSFGASSLGRRREELIHILVSSLVGCVYCETSHRTFLETEIGRESAEEVLPALCDPEARDRLAAAAAGLLSERDLAMLRYAEKVTLTPRMADESDITALRDVGFSDEEIVDIVLQSAYRNFMVRLTLGLGVRVDDRYLGGARAGEPAPLEETR